MAIKKKITLKKGVKSGKNQSYKKKSNKSNKSNKKGIEIKGGDILTYNLNTNDYDPKYMQLDTRHMFSEQIKPMLGGKKQKKTIRKLRMKMKGGQHIGTGYFTNILNSDGGFNTSSMQNLQTNNIV